mmetsp:Transcript_22768/g.37711  ORF Transcript_22768/g.37711 Transcript_22768/m.37711 type:complete len:452 (-) Transcript_22768:29-1384(-)
MLTLGKLLVKSPKDLDNRKSSSSNWIGEISTWWGDGTDNGNGTLTVRGTKTGDTSSTLVESSKTGTKVGWVTGVSRHLTQTSRNLTKSLGPTGGGVSHHGHVHALITEVLGKGDTGVNGSLTGSHRHVGGIGDKGGTLHDTNFLIGTSDGILDGHGEFREITQHFSHLITTLSATDVDNSIGVGKLGKRLGDNSLSATESTWDSACSTEHRWEKSINDTETGDKRLVTWELLGDRTWATDRPEVGEGKLVCLVLALVVNFHNNIIDGEGILSIGVDGVDLGGGTENIRWAEDLVGVDNLVLVDNSNDVTSSDRRSLSDVSSSECPADITGKARNIHTLWHVNISGRLENVLKRTLDTIENGSHNTRTKFDGKRLLLTEHGVTNGKTGGILVNLDGGSVSLELNNLSDKLGVTDTNELVHSSSGHTIGNYQRSRDLVDKTVIGFLFEFDVHD